MIKVITKNEKDFFLRAAFNENNLNADVIKKQNTITEFLDKREAVIFLGDKDQFTFEKMKKVAQTLAKSNRCFQVDVKTFVSKNVDEKQVVTLITEEYILENGDVFTMKTNKKEEKNDLNLLNLSDEGKNAFETSKFETEARNWTRSLQIMPPNILNSENYAQKLEDEFKKIENVSVKVLNKKDIEDLKMGLLLGVNAGSSHEPRVVIVEYSGNPSSKEKTVMVGKGIMFDSGGYSIKVGKFMQGMKFDMSGTAIVAGAMKIIAKNKPKANVSIVMPLTDNKIGANGQTTDVVNTSMNGKTVEINNTDAEGRLILADAITYSVRNLKATKLIDVATLTGAIIFALGDTYAGVWTTSDEDWNKFSKAANTKGELVWRLPFHNNYIEWMKKSKIADIKNTDYSGRGGGSSSAAMFLKEFTEDIPFIHLDVAGTAEIGENPTAVLVKTLAEFVND